jgi:hypothetical protein
MASIDEIRYYIYTTKIIYINKHYGSDTWLGSLARYFYIFNFDGCLGSKRLLGLDYRPSRLGRNTGQWSYFPTR